MKVDVINTTTKKIVQSFNNITEANNFIQQQTNNPNLITRTNFETFEQLLINEQQRLKSISNEYSILFEQFQTWMKQQQQKEQAFKDKLNKLNEAQQNAMYVFNSTFQKHKDNITDDFYNKYIKENE